MRRRIDRRAFVGSGLVAMACAACGWDGGRGSRPAMNAVSRFNDWLSEQLFSSTRLSRKYRPDERTSSFPNYHISRTTPRLAEPQDWRLRVRGLVRQEMQLPIEELRALGYIE